MRVVRSLIVAALILAAMPFLNAGSAAGQNLKPTIDDPTAALANAPIYRKASLERIDLDMVLCPRTLLPFLYPDRHFIVSTAPGSKSLAGGTSDDIATALWILIAKSTGPQSSDIELHNIGATALELDLVRKMIEMCRKPVQ